MNDDLELAKAFLAARFVYWNDGSVPDSEMVNLAQSGLQELYAEGFRIVKLQ